jgi:hypothetical protein
MAPRLLVKHHLSDKHLVKKHNDFLAIECGPIDEVSTSISANYLSSKCLLTNGLTSKCLLVKCLLAKCPSSKCTIAKRQLAKCFSSK